MASLYLVVVARCVGADELVSDTQRGSGCFKQGREILLAVGESVGELEAIICLDTFHSNSPASVPFEQLFQKIGGGIGVLLGVGSQETQSGELVNGSVLKQAEFRVRDTLAGHYFHIYLDPLAGIGHLRIRLGLVCFFLLGLRKQPQFAHDPEQVLGAAGIASLSQPVPQLQHAKVRVAAADIPDQLQLRFCVLVGGTVRPPGLAGQGMSHSHSNEPSRSRYMTGSYCISGWRG